LFIFSDEGLNTYSVFGNGSRLRGDGVTGGDGVIGGDGVTGGDDICKDTGDRGE